MNNPLRYQITEYDCGPTSVLNGISALFPREVIPPDIPRYVMLYSLDGWGEDGVIGKTGTTATAMMFMSNWFNSYGRLGRIPISSHFYTGAQVNMREDGPVMEALHRGGVVVLRCYSDVAHYVLLTGIQDGLIQTFDPYFRDGPFEDPGIHVTHKHEDSYNRLIEPRVFAMESWGTDADFYACGPNEQREALVLFNEHTVLTAERTVEYII